MKLFECGCQSAGRGVAGNRIFGVKPYLANSQMRLKYTAARWSEGAHSHAAGTQQKAYALGLIWLNWGVRMAEIRLQEGESLENALRRFKRKVQTENIIGEVRRHSYYLKPGEKRRVKQALARKRARKKNRREPD